MRVETELAKAAWSALDYRLLARMALLLFAAWFIPFLGFGQEVTGPLVNALLLISVETVGISNAILVGCVPSFVAWSKGVLPAPMLVMIPFIIAGNVLLVVVYGSLRRFNYWLAVAVAAVVKMAFLWLAVDFVTGSPLAIQIGQQITQAVFSPAFTLMFHYPQFLTAVAGGIIAWVAIRGYRLANRK